MSQRCGNCVFAQKVEGLDDTKRICKNKAGAVDWWHLVSTGGICDNYYVSYVAMMAENPDDPKYKDARLIPLGKGRYTLVDQCDFEKLSRYNWFVRKHRRNFYVVRTAGEKKLSMYRQITDAAKGMVVDHIDHDGLNNRRSNLRVCTAKQNARNSRSPGGTSKYKGVSRDQYNNKWRAKIYCNGKRINIGNFKNEKQAALAYDKHARKLFGEYAHLNFPDIP